MNNSLPDISSIAGAGWLLLCAKIAPLDDLLDHATQDDMAAIEGFSSPSRRAERLAWRIMVRKSLARDIKIGYSDQGIPEITDPQYSHISVSHCADRVMVALSNKACGVDIERLDRQYAKLAARYMNSEEQLIASDAKSMAAVWCAKECLYKLSGTSGLDLRSDIRITSIDPDSATIIGQVRAGEQIKMQIMQPDEEHIAVYHI